MMRRTWPDAVRELRGREGLVQQHAAGPQRVGDGLKQIPLEITRNDHQIESAARERMPREIGAPAAHDESFRGRAHDRVVDGFEADIDAERVERGACERQRMTAASHREIERAARRRLLARGARDPIDHERRRYNLLLAQALLTAVFVSLAGLFTTAVIGLRGGDISRHITYGIFSTMVTLLAHSMMMFYLIGKGKAVKDAMAEHSVDGDHYRRIAAARKPVFSIGTLAMAVTMTAAILGASVDTGVLPPIVHAYIAYLAIACNLAALRSELSALSASSRIVDEVNRVLGP